MNRKVLTDPRHYFWLKTGGSFVSIEDLVLKLPLLSDDDFRHHVNEQRNDFANWLRDVFQEHGLAAHANRCRSKAELQTVLYNHVAKEWMRERLAEQARSAARAVTPPPEYTQEQRLRRDVGEMLQDHWRY